MSDLASERTAPAARTTALAVACALGWFAAAASSGIIGIWTALGGAAVSLGVAVLLLGRPAALLRPSPRLLLLGVAAGAVMIGATYVLYPPLARALPFIATDTAKLYAAFRAPSPLVAALALLPVILGEELVWRGAVQSAAVQRLGAVGGVSAAAIVYAAVHVPVGSPMLVVVALCCGLAWGALRVVTGSLVPTLVAHGLWNLLVMVVLPLDGR